MNDRVKMILVGVVSLLVGAAGGVGFGMMQVDEVTQKLTAVTQEKDDTLANLDRTRKMPDESAKKFGKDLTALVNAAGAATEDPAKTIDATRALLGARDQIRAALDGVRASMDGDMDALAAELGTASPNIDKLKVALESLKQSWPAKEAAIEALQKLSSMGAGGVVCYTAGFGETGSEGADDEARLVAAAGDLALVGPNCYGVINYLDKVALWPFTPQVPHWKKTDCKSFYDVYKLLINCYKNLFGRDIVVSDVDQKRIDGVKTKITKHSINKKLVNEHLQLFLNRRKSSEIDEKVCKIC